MRRAALLLLAVAGLVPFVASGTARADGAADRIDHVVVIIEQDHTFDSYFGAYPGVDGFAEAERFPRRADGSGERAEPVLYEEEPVRRTEPGGQLLTNATGPAVVAYASGRMDGFLVAQDLHGYDPELSLAHHNRETAPGIWGAADRFVLFDRYFSSVMGGSLPNALALLTGDDHGFRLATKGALARLRGASFPTVFDRLRNAGVPWRFYAGRMGDVRGREVTSGRYLSDDVVTPSILYWAPVLAMERFWSDPGLRDGFVDQERFYADAEQGTLPAVSFVLPMPTDHPISGRRGQVRLVSLLNAVAKSPLWERTAVFVIWDDWGGFYDHVPPPPGLGFRVPALLVSPWAKDGYVSSVEHDHRSVLGFLVDRFGLEPLSERNEVARGFEGAFTDEGPRRPALLSASPLPSTPVGTVMQNRLTLVLYLAALGTVGVMVWRGRRRLLR